MIRARSLSPAPAPVLAAALALAAALTMLGTGPAQAAGYRYWSFWHSAPASSAWTYATQGPATARPADGEVDGYRFSVSADSGDSARPRTAPDFATICAATPARDGSKRVGVVIDFGTPADAPAGETPPAQRTGCAQVRENATSAEALAALAPPLRYNGEALLCGIAGFPRTGCGEQVTGERPAPSATVSGPPPATGSQKPSGAGDSGGSEDGGPSLGLFAGAAAVLVLGGAAFWQARRRRG